MRVQEVFEQYGEGTRGEKNLITDVKGVKAGHVTLDDDTIHTGVTVVVPCDDIYHKKPVAAVHVINGFGKTAGLMQLEELGCIESPIALTNTLSVGQCLEGLVRYTLAENLNVRTFNPVCGETNDSKINDIASLAVRSDHVIEAIENASDTFETGSVGAGRGTICFGLKGGIGSASRTFRIKGNDYTIGILVQSNFGSMRDLTIAGDPIGKRIAEAIKAQESEDKGSIMIILATDLPVDSRQLKRILKRCETGLIRLGSRLGHGSGDVVIGFTTANTMEHAKGMIVHEILPDHLLDPAFRLAGEATEEAVLDSLIAAEACQDAQGNPVHALREFL